MGVSGWRYYNHAAIPDGAPHEKPDLTPIKTGEIWKMKGLPVLARWTTDFDCGYETNWWYIIKDTPFDASSLKAKRRYEITKGKRNFIVKQIVPKKYTEEIYNVSRAAYEDYPASYRPNIIKEAFIKNVQQWNYEKCYGAFHAETNQLCGYALLKKRGNYMDFTVLKVIPTFERQGVNAAMVSKILEDQKDFLKNGGYICDGSRSVHHETAFQDYLEKYFGFRKAYCLLHIHYKGMLRWAIAICYIFKELLYKMDKVALIHRVNSLLKMEQIIREQKN